MLRLVFTDVDNHKVVVDKIMSLNINIEEGVPADDMTAVFLYNDLKELKDVQLFDDDRAVFTGIIDEQQVSKSPNGEFIKIVARSMSALLIDNESEPVSYTNPSSIVVSNRHAREVGLQTKNATDDTYYGNLTISKGDSNWQALSDFSKKLYHSTPRVDEHGKLSLFSSIDEKVTVFSNMGKGIPYIKFTQSIRRCDELSKVRIKVTNSCGYNNVVENKDAIKRGIVRERYLNSLFTDTPVVYAENMINNSRKKAYIVTLECPGCHLFEFMKSAKVEGSICGDIDNLYVCGVHYQFGAFKDATTITLKRKEV